MLIQVLFSEPTVPLARYRIMRLLIVSQPWRRISQVAGSLLIAADRPIDADSFLLFRPCDKHFIVLVRRIGRENDKPDCQPDLDRG